MSVQAWHTHVTHTCDPHWYSAQHFLVLMHTACVYLCVWIMCGYHISAAHNSDSKSYETTPVILSPSHPMCLFLHPHPHPLPGLCLIPSQPVCLHIHLKQTEIDHNKGWISLGEKFYKLYQIFDSFLQSESLAEIEKDKKQQPGKYSK